MWNESQVKNYIEYIFSSNEYSFRGDKLWKAHPDDLYQAQQTEPFFDFYMGAAGWHNNRVMHFKGLSVCHKI